jgi:hypothetical protein
MAKIGAPSDASPPAVRGYAQNQPIRAPAMAPGTAGHQRLPMSAARDEVGDVA